MGEDIEKKINEVPSPPSQDATNCPHEKIHR